jgi:peptide/nickel transport system permease protein
MLSRILKRNSVVFGGSVLIFLVIMAIFAPLITSYDPLDVNVKNRLLSPSLNHLFGTDQLGRDVFSRVIHGTRISLRVGFISVLISFIIGALLGITAGYFGKSIDNAIMAINDVMLAFPGLLLAIAIVGILGPGINNVMIAVGIGGIPDYIRVARNQTLTIRNLDYVQAATALGSGRIRILARHILPNIVAPLIILAAMGFAGAILASAALSFIGLGAQPPSPEWGAMLSIGRSNIREAWWLATFPGIAITITVLAINILGDGLRDTLDPRLRGTY